MVCPLFPHHRWIGAADTLRWCRLLLIHGLLQAAIPVWVGKINGTPAHSNVEADGWADEFPCILDDKLQAVVRHEGDKQRDYEENNAKRRGKHIGMVTSATKTHTLALDARVHAILSFRHRVGRDRPDDPS